MDEVEPPELSSLFEEPRRSTNNAGRRSHVYFCAWFQLLIFKGTLTRQAAGDGASLLLSKPTARLLP